MLESKQTLENDESMFKNCVKFNTSLRVVLIPSRSEYKSAGLCPELWWTSSDYFMFQQSAHSEIRLLSAYENINLNAARKKLYQPCDNEAIEDSDSDNLLELVNDSIKKKKNDSNNDVHSLNKENVKDNDSDNFDITKRSLSSPKPQQISNNNNLKRVDSLTHLQEKTQHNHDNIYDDNNESKLKESNNNDFLSFCVPLKETLSVRFECKSRQSGLAKLSVNFSMLITYGSLLILIALLILDTNGYLY